MLEMMSALVLIEEAGLPLLGRADDETEGAGAGLPLLWRDDRTEGHERHAASKRRYHTGIVVQAGVGGVSEDERGARSESGQRHMVRRALSKKHGF